MSVNMIYNLTLVILLAATLHACWNALTKISGDQIVVMGDTLPGSIHSFFRAAYR